MRHLSIARFAWTVSFLLTVAIMTVPAWAALDEALPEPEPRPTFCRVDPERELVIRDLSVVEPLDIELFGIAKSAMRLHRVVHGITRRIRRQ